MTMVMVMGMGMGMDTDMEVTIMGTMVLAQTTSMGPRLRSRPMGFQPIR